MLKFSVLVDDDVHLLGCLPEKGLSLLLECDGLKVLFDSGRGGVFQGSCRLNRFFYAASFCACSGLSITVPTGVQFRVWPRHLAGFASLAA